MSFSFTNVSNKLINQSKVAISAIIAGGNNSKLVLRKIAIGRNPTIAIAIYEEAI
jgi:hypothetical protein